MKRFFLGLAIASLTASVPVTVTAGDREIADQIITSLKQKQASGSLKGFDVDLSVENGVVFLKGSVAGGAQVASVLEAAYNADGVRDVVSDIAIRGSKAKESTSPVRQASGEMPDKPIPLTIPTFESEEAPAIPAVAPEPPSLIESTSKVSAKDAKITEYALTRLSEFKAQGKLKNFDLDVSTVDSEVWVRGFVANADQKKLVLETVQRVPGVAKVIDDLTAGDASETSNIKPVSDTRALPAPAPMPIMGRAKAMPKAFATNQPASYEGIAMEGAPVEGGTHMGSSMPTPVPMNMGPSYGAGIPRHDQPQMPGYAWPSYSAYPNYAAVTYPKQYSASAWPYIGPFYPYPQVPLGWRKVALEWDDGLWYLDFTSK
jgi:osmotically-inducible protein OsmY